MCLKFYNKWLSLVGAIICFLIMIFIDKTMSVIVGCVIWILYVVAAEKKDGRYGILFIAIIA